MNPYIVDWQKEKLTRVVEEIVATYDDAIGANHIDRLNLPQRDAIYEIMDALFKVIYPGYIGGDIVHRSNQSYYIGELLTEISDGLTDQVAKALQYRSKIRNGEAGEWDRVAADVVSGLLENLPAIRQLLKQDIDAAYEGDPAACSVEEICTSYPFMTAITTHRIAHELWRADVPLIPRIMSERAHSATGIDIHPGARIGKHFFIDHGTGVVIGETTEIGENVKIYQGVTLGALSFRKDATGAIVKGGKRHPTIEANVTIYAGATILGPTLIGEGATIGGTTWTTEPVPAGAFVVIGKDGRQIMVKRHKKDSGATEV